MFEGFLGNGLYRVWNGKRLAKGVEWRKTVGYPYGEERAWQCEWSPNEKLILFRFYGHAQRDSYSPGHTVVIDPRTGRRRFDWGAEAGPARWLDQSRLIFEADDCERNLPRGLTVAKPVAHQSHKWLKNSVTWALSSRRDAIWALTSEGHLLRTQAKKRQWQVIRCNAISTQALRLMSPSMSLSPRGDMVAFCDMFGGTNVSIVSTSPKRPWTLSWKVPLGKVKVLGWPLGKSLPLLELQHNKQEHSVVIQLNKIPVR
jgi:hypothetical protein